MSARLPSFLLPFGLLPCLLGVTNVLTDVGEKECPVPFKVLLDRLRVKLTPDRLTGEKPFLILYTLGVHTDMEIPETGQMRRGCHPETRRRGLESGMSKRRNAITQEDEEASMFDKHTFARPLRNNRTQRI